ncbi:M56 family metallopeptidase [uncultured Bacteroides sp.]|uniref:M56 family metallopeptidase n=1 Tax=uncultured Bacteroides sp. TaxID=162156 RepID=UPI002AABBA19|nr:M56 family metallopeptidase [uncultured Bacteroides sp.]
MNAELTYFLKVNIAIALCYIFYRLFLYKDTFFKWRRLALIVFFVVSAFYPLLNMEGWIRSHTPMTAMVNLYATIMLPEVTIGSQQQVGTNWQELLFSYCTYIYASVCLILFIRFIIQFFSILRLRKHCSKAMLKGNKIYLLDNPSGPFSFFKWIFISKDSHTDNELNEILVHEKTHVEQWHSIDVIFSELFCVICWFNPFAWLLKHEVKCNLEYLADNRVIKDGHNTRTYQYHLLELTSHNKAAATLYNSFNVLPLKNRIKMMNRKPTKDINKSKYLLFLPLAAVLMIISNIESVARTAKTFAEKILPEQSLSIEKNVNPSQELANYAESGFSTPPKQMASNVKDSLNKEPIFTVVEQMPEFPGGQEALMNFFTKSLKYPVGAKKAGKQGRVIAQFIIEKDGNISTPCIIRSVSPDIDAEAMRIIKMMPKWKPGKQRGKDVRVKYTVPIYFSLNSKEIKNSNLPEVVTVGYTPYSPKTEEPVFQVVEKMPAYQGGMEGLMHYLASNIKYPVDAQQAKAQGRVIVQIIIDENGNVTHPSIIRSVSPSLDAEAIRVVSSMPKWTPGSQKGKNVKVKYTLPITFKLDPPVKVKK